MVANQRFARFQNQLKDVERSTSKFWKKIIIQHIQGKKILVTYSNILKFIKIGCDCFPLVRCTRKDVGTLCFYLLHLSLPYLPVQPITDYWIIFIPTETTCMVWLLQNAKIDQHQNPSTIFLFFFRIVQPNKANYKFN